MCAKPLLPGCKVTLCYFLFLGGSPNASNEPTRHTFSPSSTKMNEARQQALRQSTRARGQSDIVHVRSQSQMYTTNTPIPTLAQKSLSQRGLLSSPPFGPTNSSNASNVLSRHTFVANPHANVTSSPATHVNARSHPSSPHATGRQTTSPSMVSPKSSSKNVVKLNTGHRMPVKTSSVTQFPASVSKLRRQGGDKKKIFSIKSVGTSSRKAVNGTSKSYLVLK